MRTWLISIRETRGYTQPFVANKSGLSQGYYCDIENGKRGAKLPVKTAKAIATVLEFDWTLFYKEVS